MRKIFVGESFTVASFSGSGKSLDRRRGVSRFSVEIFCLTVPKNSVRESFVAIISGTEEVWRRGRGYQDFPSKSFCLTVPKISFGESLDVALISDSEKVYGQKRGGEYQDNPSKIFVSQCGKFS